MYLAAEQKSEQTPVTDGHRAEPLCPVFGACGGCAYQDVDYEEELKIKQSFLRRTLSAAISIPPEAFEPIVPSPKPYHYRNRLDLNLVRTKDKGVLIGFTSKEKRGVIPVESCPLAMETISMSIPGVKKEALERLTPKYRQANIVVRSDGSGKVFWGGIGRRSLELDPDDYFSITINGKRIFYSLDTFFQANLSILPAVFARIERMGVLTPETIFYDLYGGVGLFGIGLKDRVRRVVLIEGCASALKLARHNVRENKLDDLEIIAGKVEDELPGTMPGSEGARNVGMIDPPRAGLHESALRILSGSKMFRYILYLSCNPETLARDLQCFVDKKWEVRRVMPFDFFPQTKHIETLVLLKGNE